MIAIGIGVLCVLVGGAGLGVLALWAGFRMLRDRGE